MYAWMVVFGTTLFQLLIKISDTKIEPITGTVIMQLAALLAVLGVFFFKGLHKQFGDVQLLSLGVGYAVLAGATIGMVNMCIYLMYNAGAPFSLSSGITRAGPLVLSVILGVLLLKEKINIMEFSGILLSIAGIILIIKGRTA